MPRKRHATTMLAISTTVTPFFMKLIAPLYYIRKASRSGNIARLNFGDMTFYARIGTVDAIMLDEVCRFNCYKAAKIGKGDTVVDIGAHIGGYSVKSAKLGARVIAYEALPDNYQLLVQNLAVNDCNVKAYNTAVTSKNGRIGFNVDARGTAFNSIHPVPSTTRISVPSVDLHTVFTSNRLKKIDVLKMDVEGAEYDILLNARKDDLERIDAIVMEVHNQHTTHSIGELKLFLQNNGFLVKTLSMWITIFFFGTGRLLATRLAKQQPL